MKGLRIFLEFNIEKFLENKDVKVIASDKWQSYDNNGSVEVVGTKYKCVIADDETFYGKDDIDNTGEQLIIKVKKPVKNFKKFSSIRLVNAIGKVYGDYQNNLSIEAEDIIFVESK